MSTKFTPQTPELMTPAEVATAFRVDPKTVTRWAVAGKLTSIRTLGGHRRYDTAQVQALLNGGAVATAGAPAPVAYPTAAPVRSGLTGHTITVECLPQDVTPFHVERLYAGRLAVVERTDGRFGKVCALEMRDDDGPFMEGLARSYASGYGARYVQNGATR